MASVSGTEGPAFLLDAQPNFRDLGGSPTAGGSLVATGEVYRSGELSSLTDADLGRLEELGIRTVVDLRSEREAALLPDRLPASVTYVSLPLLPGDNGSAVERFLQTFDPADFPPWDVLYRTLVRKHTAVLASLIRLVADRDSRPLVFHCGTGKDRTGIAAALLLSMLGVTRVDVEADYLRSNSYLGPRRHEIMDRWVSRLKETGIEVNPESTEQLQQMLLVEPSYLAAAWDEMVVLGGSVDGYIKNSLGIEDDVGESLRRQLLR